MEWSALTGLSEGTIRYRVRMGKSPEECFKPVTKKLK
jgi:hypothetical protein